MCFRAVMSGNAVFLESNCSAYSSKLILSLEERGLIKTSHLELSPPKLKGLFGAVSERLALFSVFPRLKVCRSLMSQHHARNPPILFPRLVLDLCSVFVQGSCPGGYFCSLVLNPTPLEGELA